MKPATNLAYHTLAWSWTVTGLAALAVGFQITSRRITHNFGVDDGLVVIAWVVGLILVAQTTWAILDEGQGEHQQTLSAGQVSRAAKVGVSNVIDALVLQQYLLGLPTSHFWRPRRSGQRQMAFCGRLLAFLCCDYSLPL